MTSRSKRELEQRLEEIEAPEDLPTVGVLTTFSALVAQTELVDRERSIWRIHGELWHDPHGYLDGSADIYDD